LKDESASYGYSDSLYRTLILATLTYTRALLKYGSAHDGHSDSLYQVLTMMIRPTQRLS